MNVNGMNIDVDAVNIDATDSVRARKLTSESQGGVS